jgi:putative Mg2+ transporter-C (MgtC) family protein
MEQLLEDIGQHTHVPFPVIAARLALATVLGAAVGLEREWRQRPAGLRTHILVCLAAALVAILTIEIAHLSYFESDRVRIDPLRSIEAVTHALRQDLGRPRRRDPARRHLRCSISTATSCTR